MMTATVPPMRQRLLGLTLLGWAVASVRFTLDFMAMEQAMWFGVYYAMPPALAWVGLRGRWGAISWRSMATTTAVLGLVIWGIPNAISYTTGQFLEWTHGRFEPGVRATSIAAHEFGKLGWGLLQGLLTAIAGALWCTAWGTLLIWLPGRRRSRSAPNDGFTRP